MAEMKRWKTGDQEWECDASDHGPFCRSCRKVGAGPERPPMDREALIDKIVDGMASRWWSTAEGRAHAAVVLSSLDDLGLRIVTPADTAALEALDRYIDARNGLEASPTNEQVLETNRTYRDLMAAGRARRVEGVPDV